MTSDVYLPAAGENGSKITWTSSDERVITPDGKLQPPSYLDGDRTVTLTAVITKGM